MAQDRIAQIRELLEEEQSFELCKDDADLEKLQHTAHEYRDLLLKLKGFVSNILSEQTLQAFNDIDLNIHNVVAVKKARAQLHGLIPNIEDALEAHEKSKTEPVSYIDDHIQNGSYSTLYIDLMIRAIKEIGITEDRQPAKDDLIEWFREQNPALSGRDLERMACLTRNPSSRTGGHSKSKKITKG